MQTERKADFIDYIKALENGVAVLQTEANKVDALNVYPPPNSIDNTGTSDTATTFMEELRKYYKTQAESMAHLTKMMTMFLVKYPAGKSTGVSDKD